MKKYLSFMLVCIVFCAGCQKLQTQDQDQTQAQAQMSYEEAWAQAYSVRPKGTVTNGVPDSIQVVNIKLLRELLGDNWFDQANGAMRMQTRQGGGASVMMAPQLDYGTDGGGTINPYNYTYLGAWIGEGCKIISGDPTSGSIGYYWQFYPRYGNGTWVSLTNSSTYSRDFKGSVTSEGKIRRMRSASEYSNEVYYYGDAGIAEGVRPGGEYISTHFGNFQPWRRDEVSAYVHGGGAVISYLGEDEVVFQVLPNTTGNDRSMNVYVSFIRYLDDGEIDEDYLTLEIMQYGQIPNINPVTGGTIVQDTTYRPYVFLANVTYPTEGELPYLYKWFSCTDNVGWNLVAGATDAYYSGPPVYETTYFRRRVYPWNGYPAYSNTVTVVPGCPAPAPGAL